MLKLIVCVVIFLIIFDSGEAGRFGGRGGSSRGGGSRYGGGSSNKYGGGHSKPKPQSSQNANRPRPQPSQDISKPKPQPQPNQDATRLSYSPHETSQSKPQPAQTQNKANDYKASAPPMEKSGNNPPPYSPNNPGAGPPPAYSAHPNPNQAPPAYSSHPNQNQAPPPYSAHPNQPGAPPPPYSPNSNPAGGAPIGWNVNNPGTGGTQNIGFKPAGGLGNQQQSSTHVGANQNAFGSGYQPNAPYPQQPGYHPNQGGYHPNQQGGYGYHPQQGGYGYHPQQGGYGGGYGQPGGYGGYGHQGSYGSHGTYTPPGSNVHYGPVTYINGHSTPSYSYSQPSFSSTLLSFMIGYQVSNMFSHSSHTPYFHDHTYVIHHYDNEKKTVPEKVTVQANTIVTCPENITLLCLSNSFPVCMSNGTIMCVTSPQLTAPCKDNSSLSCVDSTINCVNNTSPACNGTTGDGQQNKTTTLSVPCVSSVSIYGDLSILNNATNFTMPQNVTINSQSNNTITVSDNSNTTNTVFCVTVLAIPAPLNLTAVPEIVPVTTMSPLEDPVMQERGWSLFGKVLDHIWTG